MADRCVYILLLYPVAAIAALWAGQPWLKLAALPVMITLLAWPALARGRGAAWLALAASILLAMLALIWPAFAGLAPALAVLGLAAWFFGSLRPGGRPLVQRFAQTIHRSRAEPMPAGSARWLRRWTWVWALALSALGVITAALAIRGFEAAWLVWSFAVIPLTLAALLFTEYHFRLRCFPDYPHMGLREFMRTLLAVRWHHLA